MKLTRTSCLAIMLSLWLHPTTAQQFIVPRVPPNMGSCSRLTEHDMSWILGSVAYQNGYVFHSLYEYQPICSVSGLYRDTYSQYSVLAKVICIFCVGNAATDEVVQVTFICHKSTNSYYKPNVAHPSGSILHFHHTDIFSPAEYKPKCGNCAAHFRQHSIQYCRGMY